MVKPAIAIIQARMSSNRLPGKVLKPLAGKPMIWHIYQRALECRHVDKVIIAMSDETSDDPLAAYCQTYDLNFFRGSLNNVLDRFLRILKENPFSYTVRITGDCPLICPEYIDQRIIALNQFDGDLTWLRSPFSCLEGQGVHSSRSLFHIQDRSEDPDDLEHVGSKYIAKHPEEFRIVEMNIPKNFCCNEFRLTVDEEDDYKFMHSLYAHLYKSSPIKLTEALKWLKHNPGIASMNYTVKHRKLNIELENKKRQWSALPKAGLFRWDNC